MGHPMGAPYVHPVGCTLFLSFRGRTSTRLRLVTGSNAPPKVVHMGAPMGHPLQHVKSFHPLGDNPFGVNFGLNYRDLGNFMRVTFLAKLPAPYRVPTWSTFSWSHHVLPSATLRGPQCTSCIWVPYRAPTFKINCIYTFGEPMPHMQTKSPIGTSHCERLPTVK